MSDTEEVLDSNPFGLAITFIMSYNDMNTEVGPDVVENLRELLVAYVKQEQEIMDILADKEYYDDELAQIIQENSEYLDIDYEPDPDVFRRCSLLKRIINQITLRADTVNEKEKVTTAADLNIHLANNYEEMELKVIALTEELQMKNEILEETTAEKNELDAMVKDMDFRLEENDLILQAKNKEITKTQGEYEKKREKLHEEAMELRSDCSHYKDLHTSAVQSIKEFKSGNSEKFKNMMEEQELLKKELVDYKVREAELEKKMGMMKIETSRKEKLIKNIETREFILKQQLESTQNEIEEEKRYHNAEMEELQTKFNIAETENLELKTENAENNQSTFFRKNTIEQGMDMQNLLSEFQDEEFENNDLFSSRGPIRGSVLSPNKEDNAKLLEKLNSLMSAKKKTTVNRRKREGHLVEIRSLENELRRKKKEFEAKIKEFTVENSKLSRDADSEKNRAERAKQTLERKLIEIKLLRKRLLNNALDYSDKLDSLNGQVEESYEINNTLKKQLQNSKIGNKLFRFKKSLFEILDEE